MMGTPPTAAGSVGTPLSAAGTSGSTESAYLPIKLGKVCAACHGK